MIRRNVDIIAVTILILAAVLCSSARQITVHDVFTRRTVVFRHSVPGPNVEVVSLLPIFGLLNN